MVWVRPVSWQEYETTYVVSKVLKLVSLVQIPTSVSLLLSSSLKNARVLHKSQ